MNGSSLTSSGPVTFSGNTLDASDFSASQAGADMFLQGNGNVTFDMQNDTVTFGSSISDEAGAISAVLASMVYSGNGPDGLPQGGGSGLWDLILTNGTLVLNGNNSLGGTIQIGGGTLQLGAANALQYAQAIQFGTTSQTATFTKVGVLQYAVGNSYDYSGQFSGGITPIAIDLNDNDVTFASNIASSNTEGLIVQDSSTAANGVLTLLGPQSFIGGITVNSGGIDLSTYSFDSDGKTSASAPDVSIDQGGTIMVQPTQSSAPAVTTGALSLTSDSTLVVSAYGTLAPTSATLSGDITVTFVGTPTNGTTYTLITSSGTISTSGVTWTVPPQFSLPTVQASNGTCTLTIACTSP